jgi:hypothetical protein
MIFEELAKEKLGMHSISTIIYYFQVVDKYNALKLSGLEHWEICENIGVSEKHYYRIKKVVKKVKKSL